jgi:nicotinamidase-related amidase
MQALLVVDAQNEFSSKGHRPVPNHTAALARIEVLVAEARERRLPVAWIQHHNRPDEGPAFQPGSWGVELSSGLGPRSGFGPEQLFQKNVYGAFTGTGLEEWLRARRVDSVLIVGFFTHMCVSTSAREALVRGFAVSVDPEATGARDISRGSQGQLSADEVRRSALLQLEDMGVTLTASVGEAVPAGTG